MYLMFKVFCAGLIMVGYDSIMRLLQQEFRPSPNFNFQSRGDGKVGNRPELNLLVLTHMSQDTGL